MISLFSAQSYLKNLQINPNHLDRDPQVLQKTLKQLGNLSLLTLKVPQSLGGCGFSTTDYGLWQITIARYSGALAFLQTQHQSAGSFLAKSQNHSLQQQYLPAMTTGEKLVGVGFSQLRRPGKPLVRAEYTDRGYLISGTVPWITGGYIFNDFIVAAILPDGRELYGILPLKNISQSEGGTIKLSPPMELMAFNSTNTISATIDNWYFKEESVVKIEPANAIHQSSKKNVLSHAWFPLGCAYSSLNILQQNYNQKQLDSILKIKSTLQQEADYYKTRLLTAVTETSTYENKLKLRSQIINFTFRCSQAAVITASGAANTLSNDAGRVYREALVFSVSGQTTDVMEATLKLVSS